MQSYEYIAVPAPRKGVSSKGVKGVPGKFANAVTILINEMAADGWDYQRSDTLPCEERQGLTGKTVKYHAMMMFRRAIEAEIEDEPLALPSPDEDELDVDDPVDAPKEPTEDTPQGSDNETPEDAEETKTD